MSLRRMPQPLQRTKTSPMTLNTLVFEFRRSQQNENQIRGEYPWAERFVLGMPLAPWQREFKWDEQQSTRFITSIWTALPIGAYTLTEPEMEPGESVVYKPFANCVMDGQQRLRTLELYLTDQLEVPDAKGASTPFSALGDVESRCFLNRVFERTVMPLASEQELRNTYDLMNFGGTAHEEDERASPSPTMRCK